MRNTTEPELKMEPVFSFLQDMLRGPAIAVSMLRAEIAAGAVSVEITGVGEAGPTYVGETDDLREYAIRWTEGQGASPRVPITTAPRQFAGCLTFDEPMRLLCFAAGRIWVDAMMEHLRKGRRVALVVEGAPPLVLVIFTPSAQAGAAGAMASSAAAGLL
jgi:hypothetical protein